MAATPVSRKFKKFLKIHDISIRKAGEALGGVSDPTIISWRDGQKVPSPEHRAAIEVWTKGEVPASEWLSKREREQAKATANVRPFDEPPPASESMPTPGTEKAS
jgi:DNA-binding transcriptional regulator YdaS (Cro superfamily)